MLILFALFDTFLFTSSRTQTSGWASTEGGLLVTESSGSSEDREPVLDKAAVMVAIMT